MSMDSGDQGWGRELRLIFKVCSAPTLAPPTRLPAPPHCTPTLYLFFDFKFHARAVVHYTRISHRRGYSKRRYHSVQCSLFVVALFVYLFVCCVVCVLHTFMQINAEYHSQ